jgi:hypothetical protein
MKLDDLLHELEAVSKVLKLPDLQNQISNDLDIGNKIKRYNALVEKISIQHDGFFDSNEEVEKILKEISELLNILSKHCDLKLSQLSFINNIKPIT